MTTEAEYAQAADRAFAAARAGETEELVGLVEAGVPVDLANEGGDTLLMLAAYHGHTAAVRALLDRGADPDKLNDRGQSPMAGAVFKVRDDVVRALLGAGGDPTAGAPSAVETAQMFGREDLLVLFERG